MLVFRHCPPSTHNSIMIVPYVPNTKACSFSFCWSNKVQFYTTSSFCPLNSTSLYPIHTQTLTVQATPILAFQRKDSLQILSFATLHNFSEALSRIEMGGRKGWGGGYTETRITLHTQTLIETADFAPHTKMLELQSNRTELLCIQINVRLHGARQIQVHCVCIHVTAWSSGGYCCETSIIA